MTSDLLMFAAVDWNTLLSMVSGAALALLGAFFAHMYDLKLERIQAQETIDGILQAIRFEMEAVLKSFEWFGEQLKDVKEGEVFAYSFQIRRDYFIVYPNNTAIVGQIGDAELVRQIIASHTAANSLLDAIAVNDTDEKRLREYQKLRVTDPAVFGKQHDLHVERMANFVPLLRQSYQELLQDAGKLTKAIDDYRQRHPMTNS